MNYQRLELHNHTNESDGSLSVKELLDYSEANQFGVMALTDHNIISGHSKATKYIEENQLNTYLIKGVELTTSYGHILVLGMETMFDFTDISKYQATTLFRRIRENGGKLIGLAHPFCVGNPIMTGCRLYFEIEDYSQVDYIEVFNTVMGDNKKSNELIGNYQALDYWEDLVLKGNIVAAVTGKDLHQYPVNEAVMVTYLQTDSTFEVTTESIFEGIRNQKTFVTKGPLINAQLTKDEIITVNISNQNNYYDWHLKYKNTQPLIAIKDNLGNVVEEVIDSEREVVQIEVNSEAEFYTIRLYDGDSSVEKLLTAGILVSRRKEG